MGAPGHSEGVPNLGMHYSGDSITTSGTERHRDEALRMRLRPRDVYATTARLIAPFHQPLAEPIKSATCTVKLATSRMG